MAAAAWLGVCAGTAVAETLTVLATTDVHGSIRRTPGVYAEHNGGSLLACASLVGEERRASENPPLLVDCGDIFQGTEESWGTGGLAMAALFNAMGYDAFVPGNHDFDGGMETLDAFLRATRAVPLAANLVLDAGAGEGLRRVAPYAIRETGGLRVAIVGLTTPNIPNWYPPGWLRGAHFLGARRTLEAVMPKVNAENPDLRILLVHQGLTHGGDDAANEVGEICSTFREFDLVLGGHLHWLVEGTRVAGTPYAQAGSGAEGVLRVDLEYDRKRGEVAAVRSRFVRVEADTPEDPALAELVREATEAADARLGEVLTTTETRIAPGEGLGGVSAMQTLLAEAFREACGADIALHGVLSRHAIGPGEVTVADAWRAVPFENGIYVVRLTGREIREALEESARYAGTARQFAASGLRYTIDPDAPPGRRISRVRLRDGSKLQGRKRYSVALNSYHLSSGGGRFPGLTAAANAPLARKRRVGAARELLVEYLRAHRPLVVEVPEDVSVVRGAVREREPYR